MTLISNQTKQFNMRFSGLDELRNEKRYGQFGTSKRRLRHIFEKMIDNEIQLAKQKYATVW